MCVVCGHRVAKRQPAIHQRCEGARLCLKTGVWVSYAERLGQIRIQALKNTFFLYMRCLQPSGDKAAGGRSSALRGRPAVPKKGNAKTTLR